MKPNNYILITICASLLAFTSCVEDDAVVEVTPVTIVANDMSYVAGQSKIFTSLDLTDFSTIAMSVGENQLWDYSEVQTNGTSSTIPYNDFSDESILDANFSYQNSLVNAITGQSVSATFIRENSDRGIFDRAIRLLNEEKVSILQGAGDLTFLTGDQVNTNGGVPLYNFPVNYNDAYSHVSTRLADFIVNLPSAGLVNTPANTLDSIFTSIQVQAWGQVKLPGYDKSFEVLVQSTSRQFVRHYLLGGALAPDNLLAGLGLSQGTGSSEDIIAFVTPTYGVIGVVYFSNGVLSSAFFRSDIPD